QVRLESGNPFLEVVLGGGDFAHAPEVVVKRSEIEHEAYRVSAASPPLDGCHVVDRAVPAHASAKAHAFGSFDEQVERLDRFAVFGNQMVAALKPGVSKQMEPGIDESGHRLAACGGMQRR